MWKYFQIVFFFGLIRTIFEKKRNKSKFSRLTLILKPFFIKIQINMSEQKKKKKRNDNESMIYLTLKRNKGLFVYHIQSTQGQYNCDSSYQNIATCFIHPSKMDSSGSCI